MKNIGICSFISAYGTSLTDAKKGYFLSLLKLFVSQNQKYFSRLFVNELNVFLTSWIFFIVRSLYSIIITIVLLYLNRFCRLYKL